MSGRDVRPHRTGPRDGQGRDAIVAAALRTFYKRGYHGTSTRDIAAQADMTAASLYHHFPNKQDILRVVMTTIMQDVLTTTRDALLRSGAEPSEQLAGLVAAWVEFHANRRVEARVGASELPYLDDEGRRLVVALRDQQEQMFVSVVNRGVQEGVFATAQPREAARAIVNMGTAVASWFRDDGTVTAQDLAQLYARFALSLVGWKGGGEEGIDSGLAH